MRSASELSARASTDKLEQRREIRRRLESAFSSQPADYQSRSAQLCERLLKFLNEKNLLNGNLAAFQPIGFEPDIRPLFVRAPTVKWSFPCLRDSQIEFRKPASATSFVVGRWGLREPNPNESDAVEPKSLRALLVPALGFDSQCNRLGKGGGHYDRALSDITNDNPAAVKIGVAFDLQITEENLPLESFDIPMDWVVTETRRLERKNQ